MRIGTHTVRFALRGGERIADLRMLIRPSVMGIIVYRYEHTYDEATQAGRFLRVSSRLNRNGHLVEVRAQAVDGAVLLDGTEGPVRLPGDAAPLSWWEMRRLGRRLPLFGTATGHAMDLAWHTRRAPAGGSRIRLQRGGGPRRSPSTRQPAGSACRRAGTMAATWSTNRHDRRGAARGAGRPVLARPRHRCATSTRRATRC